MNLAKRFNHDFKNGNFYLVNKDNMIVYIEKEKGICIEKSYYDNGRIKEYKKYKNKIVIRKFNDRGKLIFEINRGKF